MKKGTILAEIIEKPSVLSDYTPAGLKEVLEKEGYIVNPLGEGSLKGIAFENGGGYKINFGGNGLLQYHPGTTKRHGGQYYKISTSEGGTHRYGCNGREKH
ncbi:MAG: hypothetical protein J6O70_00450 [Lachnospiraceae bacterium]|nr:hypothetical protein [Lachnospiraceae bacterium]